jgi:hypothetical protein
MANEAITMQEYLKGVTAYDIADSALVTISVKHDFDLTTPFEEIKNLPDDKGLKLIDLATADLLMWCASTPSTRNDTEDSDGGWKHKEGGWQTSAYDKRQLRAKAKGLYKKWGETITETSIVRIINL